MWSMLVPSIPVMAVYFGITPGTAAQIVTALAFGRLAGMPIDSTWAEPASNPNQTSCAQMRDGTLSPGHRSGLPPITNLHS